MHPLQYCSQDDKLAREHAKASLIVGPMRSGDCVSFYVNVISSAASHCCFQTVMARPYTSNMARQREFSLSNGSEDHMPPPNRGRKRGSSISVQRIAIFCTAINVLTWCAGHRDLPLCVGRRRKGWRRAPLSPQRFPATASVSPRPVGRLHLIKVVVSRSTKM